MGTMDPWLPRKGVNIMISLVIPLLSGGSEGLLAKAGSHLNRVHEGHTDLTHNINQENQPVRRYGTRIALRPADFPRSSVGPNCITI
jgi:hypothetical protein